MRKFFWVLIVLCISVGLGILLAEEKSYAFFVYKNWSVEMPLWAAFLIAMMVILLFYFMLRLIYKFEIHWLKFKTIFRARRKAKAISNTQQGLIDLIEGEWVHAERYLLAGVNQSDTAFANYLGAAWAADESGSMDDRDLYLQRAKALMPAAHIAVDILQAQFYLKHGQIENALKLISQLQQQAPKNRAVLKLQEIIYIRTANWAALLKLLPALKKQRTLTQAQADNFERHLYEEQLKQIKNINDLRAFWHALPRHSKASAELMLAYTKAMLALSKSESDVEKLLASEIAKQWQEEMVYYYGLILSSNPMRQLARAEEWIKKYGFRSTLFLTLGRLSMRCRLWGKARSYFEQSLKADPRPETYRDYGQLLEEIGEMDLAFEAYRQGLIGQSERERK